MFNKASFQVRYEKWCTGSFFGGQDHKLRFLWNMKYFNGKMYFSF